jgi:hypothetical protein
VDGRFLSSAEANAGVRGTVRRSVELAVCGVVVWAWLCLLLHTNRPRRVGVHTAASEGLPIERVVICDTRHVTSRALSAKMVRVMNSVEKLGVIFTPAAKKERGRQWLWLQCRRPFRHRFHFTSVSADRLPW